MEVFNYLLEATVLGSVLILLVVAVRLLFRSHLGSRAIYAAWLIPVLRLLLPITFPNPLMDAFRPGFSVDPAARPVADQVRQRVIDTGLNVSALLGNGEENALHTLVIHTSSGQAGRWILLLWTAVAVLVGGWLLIRMDQVTARIRRNRVRTLEETEKEAYHALCRRYRVRPVEVYYVDRLTSGCVAGVFRRFIALPLHTPRAHVPLLLSHQLCHLRSHDPLWSVVRCLCCAIHWFNPLVWMAAWLSWRDSEMACDDRVTAKLPDLDRLAYADVIASAGRHGSASLAAADAAGASFTDHHLRQRISSVIRCGRFSRWGIALASLGAAALLAVSFATSESEPLPAIPHVPEVSWTASVSSITNDMEAVACARRFLESAFVHEDTASLMFTVHPQEDAWRVEARHEPQDTAVLLRFSTDGELLEYDGSSLPGTLSFSDRSYTHRMLTESVKAYLSAFTDSLLPGVQWARAEASADVRKGDVRILSGQTLTAEGEPVFQFIVQLEPVVRMLYCHPL